MNIEHFNIEYVVVIMAGIILYLLYYVYTKDADYSKSIHSVASVVEDLNRELYYLKKNLGETQENIESNSQRMNDENIYEEDRKSVV